MDPLSITLSITALVKLTKDVVFFVKDIKDAPDERKKFIRETSSLCGMLNTLVEFINDCEPNEPWFQAVRDLATQNGPLDQLSATLQLLKSRTNPGTGVRKVETLLRWKVVKEDIVGLFDQVERLEMLVEIALDLDHFRLSRAVKKELESIRFSTTRLQSESSKIASSTAAIQEDAQARRNTDLLNKICAVDYFQQHRDAFAKHHEGTGEWFLEDEKLQAWLRSSTSTLFCPGVPGAGKTIMSSLVIEQLIRTVRSSQYPILFVYCNYKRQNEQTYLHMASTFLRQTLETIQGISDDVHNLYQRTPTVGEVTRKICEEVANLQGLTIVIDALDECEGSTRSDLLSLIEDLQLKTAVRCLITSRDFHAGTSVQLLKSQPHLEVKASRSDLERYIRSRLKYMRVKVQADLREDLVSGVIVAADGMFLLALLLMDSFQDTMKVKKIKDDLRNLPKGLDAYDVAYNDAMERISGQAQDPKECAEKVLGLILCAQRPVSIVDVQHSLMIDAGDAELEEDNKLAIEDISSVCAGLVTIDAESKTVTLVHYTTQEYLKRNQDRWLPRAEYEIARTCLSYLLLKEFSFGPCESPEDFQVRIKDYPLATYAATYVEHNLDSLYGKSNIEDHGLLRTETIKWLQSAQSVCSMMEIKAHGQSPISITKGPQGQVSTNYQHNSIGRPDYPDGFSGLHWAAAGNKMNICKFAVSNNLDLDIRDAKGMTPLARALGAGHENTCTLLLETRKVNVNSINNLQVTPLFHAIRSKKSTQVRYLLAEPHLNREHRDRNGRTALFEAVMEGTIRIFQLLLKDPRLAPDTMDKCGRTPLSHAAELGQTALIVLLLLSHGVNADSQDTRGRTPLSYAAENGEFKSARFLIRSGNVNGNLFDSEGRTPLSYAAECGDYRVVLLLVKGYRASINVKDNNGRTPLHHAALRHHVVTLDILLENHAEANARDLYGRTALSYIPVSPLVQTMTRYEPTKGGEITSEDCARILCRHSATDIDASDFDGRTPLFYAVECGDTDTVRVLMNTNSVDANDFSTWYMKHRYRCKAAEVGYLETRLADLKYIVSVCGEATQAAFRRDEETVSQNLTKATDEMDEIRNEMLPAVVSNEPGNHWRPLEMGSAIRLGTGYSRCVVNGNGHVATLSDRPPSNGSIALAICKCLAKADIDVLTKEQLKALVEDYLQCRLVGVKEFFLDSQIDVELANM